MTLTTEPPSQQGPVGLPELAEYLGGIYDEQRSKTVLTQAGVPLARVPFSNVGRDNWTGILVEAKRLGMLEPLWEILLGDCPEDALVRRASTRGIEWPAKPLVDPPPGTPWHKDLLKIGLALLTPAIALFDWNVQDHFEEAMGTDQVLEDPELAETILRAAGSGGWLWVNGTLAVLIMLGLTVLVLTHSRGLPRARDGRVFHLLTVVVVVALVGTLGSSTLLLPSYRAAGDIQGLQKELSFGGEFPAPGQDSPPTRSRSRRQAALLYSWLHGVDADLEAGSIQRVDAAVVGSPEDKSDRRMAPGSFERAEAFVNALAGHFAMVLLTLIFCVVVTVYVGDQLAGYVSFLVVLLLIMASGAVVFLFLAMEATYARVQLPAGELRDKLAKWETARESPSDSAEGWPFSLIHVEQGQLTSALEHNSDLVVTNFWPIRHPDSKVGIACAVVDQSFGGWTWLGPDAIHERAGASSRPTIVVEIVDAIRSACCSLVGAEHSFTVRLSDGLSVSPSRLVFLECS